MEQYHKVQYYFSNNPQYNITLQHDQQDIGQLIRQTFSLKQIIFYQSSKPLQDLIQNKNFDKKIQSVFFEYSWNQKEEEDIQQPNPHKDITMEKFIIFWMKKDDTIKVKYKQYDDLVNQARKWLKTLFNTATALRIKHQNQRQQLKYFNHQKQQYLSHRGNNHDTTNLTVQFNQVPESSIQKQQQTSNHPITNSKILSPRNILISNNNLSDYPIIKKRLKWLFSQYNRKNYKNNSKLTFDQIPNQLSMFNLNIWMMFNRDFGFLKYIKKEQIHGLFKKYSQKQMMSFELFQVAILDVFRRSCKSKEEGWKILMIDTEDNYILKMKDLGVPILKNGNQENLYVTNTNTPLPQNKVHDRIPAIERINHKQFNTLKHKNSSVANKINKKFNEFEYDLQSPIDFQLEQEDRVFLKEYNTNDRKSKYVNSSKLKAYFQNQSSPSVGLLKRLDDRVKKYSHL